MEFEVKKELKKDGWDKVTTFLYVSELRKCSVCAHTFGYGDWAYIGEDTKKFFCKDCIDWESSRPIITDKAYVYGILKPLNEYSGIRDFQEEAMF